MGPIFTAEEEKVIIPNNERISIMEIKISMKNGDKQSTFKFAGDPVGIIESSWSKLAKFWAMSSDGEDE